MIDPTTLVRPNIRALTPYSSARDEYTGQGVFLDANENPYGTLNRYPDPYQRALKQRVAELKGVPAEQCFVGNGSDEAIDLLLRIFCEPGRDRAVVFPPTYGMYAVSAAINNVGLIELPLTDDFRLPVANFPQLASAENCPLLFICSPNNPTGNTMQASAVEMLLRTFRGIVVVDEAYIDFSDHPSWTARLNEFPNLVVLQTLSKAWGLAAARIGLAFASPAVVALLNKVKPPYNVPGPSQEVALQALRDPRAFEQQLAALHREKTRLRNALAELPNVLEIYPSNTNFFLLRVTNANALYQQLLEQRIVVRNRHSVVRNCLRITVGTPEENNALINALSYEKSPLS